LNQIFSNKDIIVWHNDIRKKHGLPSYRLNFGDDLWFETKKEAQSLKQKILKNKKIVERLESALKFYQDRQNNFELPWDMSNTANNFVLLLYPILHGREK